MAPPTRSVHRFSKQVRSVLQSSDFCSSKASSASHCPSRSANLVCCGDKNDTTSPTGSASPLLGTWSTGCTVFGMNSFKLTRIYSGTSVTTTAVLYEGMTCAAGSELYTGRGTATVTIGGAATAPAGATKVDLTNVTNYVTPKSAASVTEFNAESAYGKTGWVLNTEKDVTGFERDGKAVPTSVFDIFQITGTKLCLGDLNATAANDGTTDAKRPQVLETGADCPTKQ